eukprot:TRINITY_DN39201_c0_g1_i1.p1 TRINITY_DN39201_c0_g1~~TRINITY_DN39201_c0_g1_i1.p1  ORF type:complete len:128 (-),score=36.14 TRINITY_DN39201_c0_g1_i1:90-473(-)
MSIEKQLPSSVVVSVWEGEWPALKSAVSSVRRATGTSFNSASDYVDFHTYRNVALDTVAKADATAVQQSRQIGIMYRSNPWVIPVTGICASSLFVYSKSSVSYTHLRAHETPEHLVCRLLLEKKKKT